MREQIDQQLTIAIATEIGGRFIDAKRAELTAHALSQEVSDLQERLKIMGEQFSAVTKERDDLRERVTGAEAAGDTMRERFDPTKVLRPGEELYKD